VFVPEGYDHAVWGADVVLTPLNLCAQTLDGVRNHSWSRPAPATPEGAVVSWADRCAYSAHDFEDAVRAGIVDPSALPPEITERCGTTRSQMLRAFIAGVIESVTLTGQVGMVEPVADALAALRRFNYDHIYLRPASVAQSDAVIRVLRALVEYYAEHPLETGLVPGTDGAVRSAVTYVGGMTDRFAFQTAVALLGWDPATLPVGVDTSGLHAG
jgi:dGTPase